MSDETHSYVNGTSPILKWAGGKQRLLRQYAPHFPEKSAVHRYFEPFIGGGAVFFHLQYPNSTLSDRNEKLIELYRMVQRDVEGVIDALKPHRNEADYYYQVRSQDPATLTAVERAARIIFLNKTCYNGLYRENQKGIFNVPFGRYSNPKICDERKLRAASHALQGVDLVTGDFDELAKIAEAGDFYYLDPPYAPLNGTSNFTTYSKSGFDEDDQRRLADMVHSLTDKGCFVMLSNSSAELVYDLYQGHGYRFIPIKARRMINSKGDRRGHVKELLILNFDEKN